MRIAVIDSGIHAGHAHIGAIAGAIHFTADGLGDDPVDRLGHGTAVAAAIREKVPSAEIFSVKVFHRRLSAEIGALIQALNWCRDNRIDLINLSLGTGNENHRPALEAALADNAIVVGAAHTLPGSLAPAIAVEADETCPRDRFRFRDGVFLASPYPRPIPGVPPERNLNGVSFAVANMTGFVAAALASTPRERLRNALCSLAETV
jgi:hypothetical protein